MFSSRASLLTGLYPHQDGTGLMVYRNYAEGYSGNPKCGFARTRCPDCGTERLLMFSCRTRGFCPTCHAKRLEEWGEWMREKILLDVPPPQEPDAHHRLHYQLCRCRQDHQAPQVDLRSREIPYSAHGLSETLNDRRAPDRFLETAWIGFYSC
jgi:ribosomal protein S27E